MPIFRWSTCWVIGDGAAISFWYDAWHNRPLLYSLETGQKPTQPKISLRDAIPIAHTLLPSTDLEVVLSQRRDQVLWKWTASASYTAKSIYKMFVTGGKVRCENSYVWQLPVPPTVRIFVYFMLKGKILTGDVRVRRKMSNEGSCQMCRNCPSESVLHLLFLCPNAVQIWFGVSLQMGFRVMIPRMAIEEIICKSREQAHMEGVQQAKLWDSVFWCTCWMIWRQRNELIFSDKLLPPHIVVHRIIGEAMLWTKSCAKVRQGDYTLLPEPD